MKSTSMGRVAAAARELANALAELAKLAHGLAIGESPRGSQDGALHPAVVLESRRPAPPPGPPTAFQWDPFGRRYSRSRCKGR
jgi:hypothetical protein